MQNYTIYSKGKAFAKMLIVCKLTLFYNSTLRCWYIAGVLYLKNIRLYQFKNYVDTELSFCEGINCFAGPNGAGKTNILDAIYYLAFTKSYFQAQDQLHILHGQPEFLIEGMLLPKADMEESIKIHASITSKKRLIVNNNEVKKLSLHIGELPLVIITPYDVLLILEGNEERRKWMDGILSQTDAAYLNTLLQYNRILEQRNKLLKAYVSGQSLDPLLMESYNEQLAEAGTWIFEKRKQFFSVFLPLFSTFYQIISSGNESVDINYVSHLHEKSLLRCLDESKQVDMATGRTTKGIHKDELSFMLKGYSLKKTGSQGQQKSFIIALKLAQYDYIKNTKGKKPLLLLDDIFEKLDEQRLQTLLSLMASDTFGQIFITDTHLERMQQTLKHLSASKKYFMVESGKISEI